MKIAMRYLSDTMYIFTQILSIPYEFFIISYFFIKINRPKNFVLPSGVLLISNHQSRLDPFIITYCTGFKNLRKILPMRFPVTPEYMKRPILGKLIKLIGGYNIGDTPLERMRKLLYTRDILNRKSNVLIFPEGKISKTSHIDCSEFKDGISVLFETKAPIVFVRIENFHSFSFRRNHSLHKKSITYSEIIESGTVEEKINLMKKFYS